VTDTLLVDGSDLSSANRIIQLFDDAISTPALRGENITIPYSDGELRTDKYVGAKDWAVGYLVKGASFAALNDELDALYALLPDLTTSPVDASCVLTLRRTFTTGTVDKTANAEYLGGIPARVAESERHARLTLRFRLLTGVFA
jgi:hypothetical protein